MRSPHCDLSLASVHSPGSKAGAHAAWVSELRISHAGAPPKLRQRPVAVRSRPLAMAVSRRSREVTRDALQPPHLAIRIGFLYAAAELCAYTERAHAVGERGVRRADARRAMRQLQRSGRTRLRRSSRVEAVVAALVVLHEVAALSDRPAGSTGQPHRPEQATIRPTQAWGQSA